MIEVAFRNLLVNDETVGGLVSDRVYFVNRPQDERRPSVVLQLASAIPARVFEGNSVDGIDDVTAQQLEAMTSAQLEELSEETIKRDSRAGYVTGQITVTCLAPTYPQAKALAAAARSILETFSGLNDDTIISYIEAGNIRDIPAMPLQGGATAPTYGVSFDADFMHKEE